MLLCCTLFTYFFLSKVTILRNLAVRLPTIMIYLPTYQQFLFSWNFRHRKMRENLSDRSWHSGASLMMAQEFIPAVAKVGSQAFPLGECSFESIFWYVPNGFWHLTTYLINLWLFFFIVLSPLFGVWTGLSPPVSGACFLGFSFEILLAHLPSHLRSDFYILFFSRYGTDFALWWGNQGTL